MGLIRFENVLKEYKVGKGSVKAVDHISFDIDEGKLTVILGPSGSGKSTTLNLLGGMDRATSGSIMIDGSDITKYSSHQLTYYRRGDVGFVFQFYNLIPTLNAFENVDVSRKLGKEPMDTYDALKAVGLEKRSKHFPSSMSGGELQRVSIARAICKNPKVLLCDEPTGALDSETGRKVLQLLQKMSWEQNKTVIIVTHNAAIAEAADKVIRMKDGHVVEEKVNENPIPMEKVVW